MLKQEQENRSQMDFFCVDEFVPQEHLLRKIENLVDLSHIYDMVEELYCPDNGRPSCDPVVLFKMVIIQHLYGIPSLRIICSRRKPYSSTVHTSKRVQT